MDAGHRTGHAGLRVHAALTVVALLFSANYIVSKLAMRAFHPLVFAVLRVVGAAIVLQVVMRERKASPLSRRDAWQLAGFATLAVVINQTFFLGGLSLTSAHVAAILITTLPVFALGTAIAVGRERATSAKIGGIALAAAGALLVVAAEGWRGHRNSLLGDLLLVGNSLAYALYLVLSKPIMARLSARRVIARMFTVAAVIMVPLAAWPLSHQSWNAIPMKSWVALVLVILGPTVTAYLLNAWALRYADSSTVAAYTYAQPVITVGLAAVFLQERIRPLVILAAAMIFAGVYISGRRVESRPNMM